MSARPGQVGASDESGGAQRRDEQSLVALDRDFDRGRLGSVLGQQLDQLAESVMSWLTRARATTAPSWFTSATS